jgi:hypothetical protein
MAHWTQEDTRPPGWEEYARENAVVLLDERDAKIRRLRREVREGSYTFRQLRREIARLQGIIEGLAARVAAQTEIGRKRRGLIDEMERIIRGYQEERMARRAEGMR